MIQETLLILVSSLIYAIACFLSQHSGAAELASMIYKRKTWIPLETTSTSVEKDSVHSTFLALGVVVILTIKSHPTCGKIQVIILKFRMNFELP